MTLLVELVDIKITLMEINYVSQFVRVEYQILDQAGTNWQNGVAFFWVTVPPEPPEGYPDDWYSIPSDYITTLVQLRDDVDAAITARILG